MPPRAPFRGILNKWQAFCSSGDNRAAEAALYQERLVGMRISDLVSQRILELLQASEDGIAEICRNDLAEQIGCVPSQINYVLTSRFTPEQGYLVESRRGGGGYIRITRVRIDRSSALMHLINTIGDSLDCNTGRIILDNLYHQQMLSPQAHSLMRAAMDDKCYRQVGQPVRDSVRAAVLKQMLLTII